MEGANPSLTNSPCLTNFTVFPFSFLVPIVPPFLCKSLEKQTKYRYQKRPCRSISTLIWPFFFFVLLKKKCWPTCFCGFTCCSLCRKKAKTGRSIFHTINRTVLSIPNRLKSVQRLPRIFGHKRWRLKTGLAKRTAGSFGHRCTFPLCFS